MDDLTVLRRMDEMCAQTLSPDKYGKWLVSMNALAHYRISLHHVFEGKTNWACEHCSLAREHEIHNV